MLLPGPWPARRYGDDAAPDDVRLTRIARVLPELLPEPSRFELRSTKFDQAIGALLSQATQGAKLSVNDRERMTQV